MKVTIRDDLCYGEINGMGGSGITVAFVLIVFRQTTVEAAGVAGDDEADE